MAKLDGSCLCGKVAYSCAAEPLATVVCHCAECQNQTGTSFSIIVAVPRDAVAIAGDSLASYTTVGTDTGKEVSRQFCRECGSPVLSLADATPELAYIKAGTLYDASWLEPSMHAWCDSAQPWIPLGDELDVELELDTEPREVTVPPDLAVALEGDAAARAFFETLSYSQKQWYVLPIEQAKQAETRERRVVKALGMLREGRKR